MFNPDFSSSFEKSPSVDFRNILNTNLKGKAFTDSVNLNDSVVRFDFYDESVKESKKDESVLFTNHLSNNPTSALTIRLQELGESPSVINDGRTTSVRVVDKVEHCANLYIDYNEDDHAFIFKTDLQGIDQRQLGFRVFSLFQDFQPGEKGTTFHVSIFLIDPYHLVIPSRYKEKKRVLSKEEMEKFIFNQHRDNAACMSKYLNGEIDF